MEKSDYYTGCDVPNMKLRSASGKIIFSDEQDSLVRIRGVEASDGSKKFEKIRSGPRLQGYNGTGPRSGT